MIPISWIIDYCATPSSFEQMVQVARMCCVGNNEQVYQVPVTAQANGTATLLDAAPLGNRKTLAIYNAGTNPCELKPNTAQVTYGQAFPILPGGYLIISIDPTVKHYVVCNTGLTTDLRVLEIGADS